ncbi:MAG: hypothetical protein J2P36_20575 [Ktedonobacteraceae bacterium]|nr:hypothetical protein [Ktedonobacteraceae bacterium]
MTSQKSHTTGRRFQWLLPALVLLVMLLALIGIVGYALAARNYATHSGFLAKNGMPLKIVAARGEIISLSVKIPVAHLGYYWATDQGVRVTLDGVRTPLMVIGPKPKDWGDTINTISGSADDSLTVTGSVTVPSLIDGPERRSLSGQLSGTILYPSAGLNSFHEETVDISVPLQLQLMPPATIEGRFLFDAFSLWNIVFCGVLFLGLFAALIWSLVSPRHRGLTVLGNLGGGIFVGIICALILWGLFALSTSIGISTPLNDEISHRNLLMACIAGGSLLVIYITVLADMLD